MQGIWEMVKADKHFRYFQNMIRAPLVKALGTLGSPTHQIASKAVRTSAALAQTPAKAPEKIEVFVDDIPVKVAPGTTVLQVNGNLNC